MHSTILCVLFVGIRHVDCAVAEELPIHVHHGRVRGLEISKIDKGEAPRSAVVFVHDFGGQHLAECTECIVQ